MAKKASVEGSRNIFKRHFTAFLERDAGADNKVLHSPRDDDVSWLRVVEEA